MTLAIWEAMPSMPPNSVETGYAPVQRDKGLAMRNGCIRQRMCSLISPTGE